MKITQETNDVADPTRGGFWLGVIGLILLMVAIGLWQTFKPPRQPDIEPGYTLVATPAADYLTFVYSDPLIVVTCWDGSTKTFHPQTISEPTPDGHGNMVFPGCMPSDKTIYLEDLILPAADVKRVEVYYSLEAR